MSDTTPAELIAALLLIHPRIGGAYIAALQSAGYSDATIQDDYYTHVRTAAWRKEEDFFFALRRRTKEVGKQ